MNKNSIILVILLTTLVSCIAIPALSNESALNDYIAAKFVGFDANEIRDERRKDAAILGNSVGNIFRGLKNRSRNKKLYELEEQEIRIRKKELELKERQLDRNLNN